MKPHKTLEEWNWRLINVSVPLPQSIRDEIYNLIPEGRRTLFMREAIINALHKLQHNKSKKLMEHIIKENYPGN